LNALLQVFAVQSQKLAKGIFRLRGREMLAVWEPSVSLLADLRTGLPFDSLPGEFCYLLITEISYRRIDSGSSRPITAHAKFS